MPILTDHPVIPTEIRARRRRLDLTQAELAQKCSEHGCPTSQGQISSMETGRYVRPYMPRLRAVAASLACDVDDLIAADVAA